MLAATADMSADSQEVAPAAKELCSKVSASASALQPVEPGAVRFLRQHQRIGGVERFVSELVWECLGYTPG